MGAGASSDNAAISALAKSNTRAKLLVNGHTREVSSRSSIISRNTAVKKPNKTHKEEVARGDEEFHVVDEADEATLQVLNAVKEAERLVDVRGTVKLQLLHSCYPLLEQVPAHRFDHLAVLVYQKEGDVFASLGDVESAKTVYARAIQIAETRVARGEKEMYMVLKRYVLAMVGMARIWYEQERNTIGFTFANNQAQPPTSSNSSVCSDTSFTSSILSDSSIFSLNQEVLKSIVPKQPRRRVGPTVSVVKIPRPKVTKPNYTTEDDFVLRSQMTRELKASPCELLLLRCIEVVEIGHRRQSELLIPALVELAQIYEDLHLYNRALLLVRRCLGILCVVYDYDHPWIIQLRRRSDYLVKCMEHWSKGKCATKIQATWKMYRAMCLLESVLGRTVTRHVWMPRPKVATNEDMAFLNDFVNDLPDGAVLAGGDGSTGETTPDRGPSIPVSRSSPNADVSPEVLRRRFSHTSVPSTVVIHDSRVVGNSRNTHTDTTMQKTDQGDVVTVRTVTTHRVVTEQVVDSDKDSNGEECLEESYEDGSAAQRQSSGDTAKQVGRGNAMQITTVGGRGGGEEVVGAESLVQSISSYLSSPGDSKRRLRAWKAGKPE
ncbi:hypothetical protein, conserved [Trypanosoma brucei gambiense DAL972]|uniref:Uncharacterized protein n=1 Tax=Trypanosoma brucei gambiense (strain MHOM/CI/86/DAL972) TaxID=679716 RepID=C9ZY79_TRYB9|nr:hypothetical protein, conserved [Trypanosoma brucei gambiense DAL972]CBH14378.1 hypothetical protein, conserved [Trypanosoma brucei gambiense DAL972]|eukprot:XP_011776644.1 hypothetical protein, conserved [Trypanosoma brucei gambiense DAL972]